MPDVRAGRLCNSSCAPLVDAPEMPIIVVLTEHVTQRNRRARKRATRADRCPPCLPRTRTARSGRAAEDRRPTAGSPKICAARHALALSRAGRSRISARVDRRSASKRSSREIAHSLHRHACALADRSRRSRHADSRPRPPRRSGTPPEASAQSCGSATPAPTRSCSSASCGHHSAARPRPASSSAGARMRAASCRACKPAEFLAGRLGDDVAARPPPTP